MRTKYIFEDVIGDFMKIGILSMQRIENFGSLLQAYALKKTLETFGNEVSFIDIQYIEEDNKLLNGVQQDFSFERGGKSVKQFLLKFNKYFFNRLKNLTRLKKQNALFESFRQEKLFNGATVNQYDMAVIGSDEVFNCMSSGDWGYTSQLFGNIPEASKIVTYAASCGSTNYDSVPQKVKVSITNAMQNISKFSVRDANTIEFVSHFTDKKIEKNFDPVLIYDFSDEIDKVELPKTPQKYCIIYSYGNRICDKKEIKAIIEFCKKRQLTLVTVGGPQFWVKKHILCSPFQCLKLFQKADFVITDTFHGTIFSIKYAKRFAVIIRDSNRNKLKDLVLSLKCDKHVIKDGSELERAYNLIKNDEEIKDILKSGHQHTLEYLRECQK